MAQLIMIVQILIAKREAVDALGDQRLAAVSGPACRRL
jgi:hypothetical protein